MATQAWPTTAAFAAAQFALGVQVSASRSTAFFTGTVTQRSNLADRLRATLTLPPCSAAHAAEREAFLFGVASTGDYISMPLPHRLVRRGTLGGSPTVAATTAAGVRSLVMTDVRTETNLIYYPQSLGTAPWYSSATVTANTHTAPDNTATADTVEDTSVVSTLSRIQTVAVPNDGTTYTASVYLRKTSGGTSPTFCISLALRGGTGIASSARFNSDTGAILGGTAGVENISPTYLRVSCSLANNASGNNLLDLYLYPAWAANGLDALDVTQTGSAVCWGAMVNTGATALPYPGLPSLLAGDWFSVGGNLLQCGYAGALATSGGNMTVPLTLPAQQAMTAGAAVTYSAPTGLWQLDDSGLQLDYSAPIIQGGIALPLLQVIA